MKYHSPKVNQDGWTDWFVVKPSWKMRCCDCALVHNFEFLTSARVKNGRVQTKIHIRVKRDNRATAASRRKE